MIDKRTVIDQIEVTRAGPILIRFAIELYDVDTDVTLSHSWHRTSIAPGDDLDAVIKAVNDDITVRPGLRAAPISGSMLDRLVDIVAAAHTPEIVQAHLEAAEAPASP
jgi:hypothetical protein